MTYTTITFIFILACLMVYLIIRIYKVSESIEKTHIELSNKIEDLFKHTTYLLNSRLNTKIAMENIKLMAQIYKILETPKHKKENNYNKLESYMTQITAKIINISNKEINNLKDLEYLLYRYGLSVQTIDVMIKIYKKRMIQNDR